MRDTIWLVCNVNGITGTRKSAPPQSSLKTSERAVRVVVEIPPAAFTPPAIPTATITVPASALRVPEFSVQLDLPDADAEPVGDDSRTPDAPPDAPAESSP